MALTPTTAATTAAATTKTTSAASAKDDTAGNTLTADFNTFLKLLTTQMKNQDPLQPMDSTEFVSQLASFSSVEQQVTSNTKLDGILSALGAGSTAGFAEWIGKSVRAATGAEFSGAAIAIAATPRAGAETATLVVKNDLGAEVARLAVDPKAETLSWNGEDASGVTQPNGTYSFAVESFSGETSLGTTPGEVYSTVTEVRRDSAGATQLLLANGDQIDADAVTALR